MSIPSYEYTVDDCDVPAVRRASLSEYRTFRRKCLEYLRGESDTSVSNQIYDLTWHTVVFRTLNEARRIEPDKQVNGAFWELTCAGYANLMTLGIRKLVDKDPKTDSVWNVITQIERRPELLTREKFICHDGLPYDWEAGYREHIASLDPSRSGLAQWLPTRGPKAWATSEMMHKAFDKLCGQPKKRRRTDTIHPAILEGLKAAFSHPAITKVCTLADKRMAHAERISETSTPSPTATYEDIDIALREITRIVNFLSTSFFYDSALGSVVATPQFNVLEALDKPWVATENIPLLHEFWNQLSRTMDSWVGDEDEDFLPKDI